MRPPEERHQLVHDAGEMVEFVAGLVGI